MSRAGFATVMLPLVLAAACGGDDPTGLGDFDPTTSDEQAQDVLATVGNSEAIQSITVLADAFVIPTAAAAVRLTVPFAPRVRSQAAWSARAGLLRDLSPSFGTTGATIIFPTDALGRTYVYNSQAASYETSDRTGAPADGIRFILYAVDPVLSRVVTPLEEIGHLDLIDRSTATENTVGIIAVVADETLLDYDASASFTTTSLSFSAAGYISDGTTRVDFDLSQSLSQEEFEISYEISVAGAPRRVAIHVTGNLQSTLAHIELTIEHDEDTIILDVEGTNAAITGTITHNGRVAIRISGPGTDPVFTDADGNPLTPAQLQGVQELFDLDDLFEAFDNLLLPAYLVLPLPT